MGNEVKQSGCGVIYPLEVWLVHTDNENTGVAFFWSKYFLLLLILKHLNPPSDKNFLS